MEKFTPPVEGRCKGDYWARIEHSHTAKRPYLVHVWQWCEDLVDCAGGKRGYWTDEYVWLSDHESQGYKSAKAAIRYKHKVLALADKRAIEAFASREVERGWVQVD